MNPKQFSSVLGAIAIFCGVSATIPPVAAKPATPQTTAPSPINAGQGIGQLKLGQTLADVQKIMGPPQASRSFEQEKERFESAGRNVELERLFDQGFDTALEYSQKRNRTAYPVFKVYLKNNRVVQINLSMFMYSAAIAQNARLNRSNLGLLSTRDVMERVMGKNYFAYQDELDFETFEYLQRGVSFLFNEGKVATILIYKPLTTEQQSQFIRKRSPLPQT